MNDPMVASPVRASQDSEEPPSWWRKLCRRAPRLFGATRPPSGDEHEALREAVEELIEEQDQDTVPVAERMLINNVLNLHETYADDCMVPRADIVATDVSEELSHVIALMIEHGHSRIPAYRDTLDEVVGMIHIKDVLACMAENRSCRLDDLLRPVLFIAPSTAVSRLLQQMRLTRHHMAMVVDEFGGIDGLVTIENLLEQVVGEIEDEHDVSATPDVIARPDGTLLVDARLPIESFEERVGSILNEEERETIDTLGGYVLHRAGHVPKIGEKVEGPRGLLFEILATEQSRIRRVRVRSLVPPQAATAAPSA